MRSRRAWPEVAEGPPIIDKAATARRRVSTPTRRFTNAGRFPTITAWVPLARPRRTKALPRPCLSLQIPNEQPRPSKPASASSSRRSFLLEVDFQAAPGFTILFGPSGAGKTTLLDCIAGLTTPESGRIAIGDRVWFDSAQRTNLPVAKRHVGYVFQTLALFPHLTVEQNVEYGLAHLPRPERAKRSSAILQAFRIAAPRTAQRPRDFRWREPARGTGADAGDRSRSAACSTNRWPRSMPRPRRRSSTTCAPGTVAHRIPILYVTHSREEVFALGERVIVLDAGRIVAQGTPHEVMSAPQQETVAQLVGFENIFDAVVERCIPERGTMACRVAGDGGPLVLETPLVRGGVGSGAARRNSRRRHSAGDDAARGTKRAQRDSGTHHIARAARCNRFGAGKVPGRDGGSPDAGRARFAAAGGGQGSVAGDQDTFVPLDEAREGCELGASYGEAAKFSTLISHSGFRSAPSQSPRPTAPCAPPKTQLAHRESAPRPLAASRGESRRICASTLPILPAFQQRVRRFVFRREDERDFEVRAKVRRRKHFIEREILDAHDLHRPRDVAEPGARQFVRWRATR